MATILLLWLQDPVAVKTFLKLVTDGQLVERDGIFSLFDARHRDQMVALFEVLYGASDYDTFLKAAVWARDRTNPRQFLYAFSVALLHREDCKGLRLPPAYEITPHVFLTTDVVRKAYQAKMTRVSARGLNLFSICLLKPRHVLSLLAPDVCYRRRLSSP
jgi:hypothetical protein